MKRIMFTLAVAVFMGSPAAAMDCGDAGKPGEQTWLDFCRLALADDSAFGLMETFGPNWIVAENQPCQLYFSRPSLGQSVTWSGSCMDGKGHGEGQAEWRAPGEAAQEYIGSMRAGKPHGWGVLTSSDGRRYEGGFRDGEMHGSGVFRWDNGDRYEGQWRNGQPHGQGMARTSSGDRYEGQWRYGCFESGGSRAWLFASREDCGF